MRVFSHIQCRKDMRQKLTKGVKSSVNTSIFVQSIVFSSQHRLYDAHTTILHFLFPIEDLT